MSEKIANDELNSDCPLLNRKIDEGACYDINAVVEEWVIDEILNIIESQYEVKIDLKKAKLICFTCRYYPFKHLLNKKSH